ncbi:ABC transporter substrate-binding protein [Ochrobactrum pecoris]|nr:ABC transporter substrate-binding protein [Brucella pecoris]
MQRSPAMGVLNTLDPGKASLVPEFYMIWGLYNALLTFDDKMQIVPDLAESYELHENGALGFKLRSGVKFHDGSTLTAEDVKFSLERLLDKDLASPNASKVAAIETVEVIDDLNLTIHTKGPFAPLLTFLTNARTGTQILSKSAYEKLGPEGYARTPVGTGPYKLATWDAGTGLKLEAFEDYFEGAPAIKTVHVPLIVEEPSGVTALLGGQIDMTSTVPTSDVPQLMNNSDVEVLRQPGLNVRFISLNLKKPPFDDVHFRRAVSAWPSSARRWCKRSSSAKGRRLTASSRHFSATISRPANARLPASILKRPRPNWPSRNTRPTSIRLRW